MLGSSNPPWRTREKKVAAENTISVPSLGFLSAHHALLAFLFFSCPVQYSSAHGLRLQPPLDRIKVGSLSPQGLPDGPEIITVGRAGEDENLALLELIVPEFRVFRGHLHVDEDGVDTHPGKSPSGQDRGQGDEENEDHRTDTWNGKREDKPQDGEDRGETYGDHEAPVVVGHDDVPCSLREGFRLVGVLALQDHREIHSVDIELS